jgi:hypothetical protein
MTKKTCLNILHFSALTIVLSGCGAGNSKAPVTFSTSAALSEERILTSNERNIATRICYAYKSKSSNFRSGDFIKKSFTFSSQKTDCQNSVLKYQVAAGLQYDNNNNLIFTPGIALNPSFRFYSMVQTDTNGYLSQLCTKIKNNEAISNTTTTNNVKVQISFDTTDMDSYQLMYFNRQSDGTYKVDSAEKFKVRTQFSFTTGQILGMDQVYSTQKVCSSFDKIKNSDFTQTFISQ